ncbi:hypothetical protein [Embleya sp. NBC_00896]|uniref:hypothetical protein n=1 Tax=Embleya sp. NBC_00896 TaxID=2975961 RepID=UPI0038680469|nr:transposase [Embleya sp. NBC_00896]
MVAADCAYGDRDGFRSGLVDAGLPFVMALKPCRGAWNCKDAFRPTDAAREPTRAGRTAPATGLGSSANLGLLPAWRLGSGCFHVLIAVIGTL